MLWIGYSYTFQNSLLILVCVDLNQNSRQLYNILSEYIIILLLVGYVC